MTIMALPYSGGKSPNGPRSGLCQWIATALGPPLVAHIEPFCGMAGVLLARKPSEVEMINDADRAVFRFWLAVRDHGDELRRRLALTPWSREAFDASVRAIREDDHEDVVACGVAVAVVLAQSAMHGLGHGTNWTRRSSRKGSSWPRRLDGLTERMMNVQLENRDAVEVLEWTAGDAGALVYCDPPYPGTANAYRCDVDYGRMESVLREHKGRVAVSGYGDYWDMLGWQKSSFATFHCATGRVMGSDRTEMLWTNFEPFGRQGELI